jgi:hypothetical protein
LFTSATIASFSFAISGIFEASSATRVEVLAISIVISTSLSDIMTFDSRWLWSYPKRRFACPRRVVFIATASRGRRGEGVCRDVVGEQLPEVESPGLRVELCDGKDLPNYPAVLPTHSLLYN